MSEVLEEIRRIAAADLDYSGAITPQLELVRDLQLDSMGMMTLAVGLEDKFRVRLNEADAATLVTVADVMALVEQRVKESA